MDRPKLPVDMTAANLLDLSAFGSSFNIQTTSYMDADAGRFSISLHTVPIEKAPALAAHLASIGFDVNEALTPSGSAGYWYLRASADIGVWSISFMAYVNEARNTEKREPKPLSEISP